MKRLVLTAALAALCALVLPATASLAGTSAGATSAAAATAATTATAATAATAASTGSATYHGTSGSAARLAQAVTVSSFPKVTSAFRDQGPRVFPPVGAPKASASSAATAVKAPGADSANAALSTVVSGAPGNGDSGAGVIHRFNGLSDVQSDSLNGFPITPPDQGLCVGYDGTLTGSPKAVWEPINLAARETTTNGALLRPDVSLATLFQDPYAEGDVRCLYDPSTKSFYFTEIGFPVATGPAADDNNTTADVVVMNAHGVAAYQFDTSLGGPDKGDCFGDQPKTGFDDNALVISTDEYCGPTESNYEGAIVLTISKPELVSEASTVSDSVLGPVSLSGIPVTGLDPAINTGSGTGYLVNSFAFLANSDNNPVGNSVGSWTLQNTAAVTTGHGTPALTGTATPSEPYAFPVPATSTGNGSTTTITNSDGTFVVTSETALNSDDSRMSAPVAVTRTFGGIQLWTSLDAAVTVNGVTTDAAAWFEIDPVRAQVVSQGYVVAKGANLLYPAIQPQQSGPAAMVFTITSNTINPSAAYTTVGSGKITTVAAGAGPHVSFSDAPPYNTPRWGDYSFAALDPDGSGVWLATEYIPPAADQDPLDNWGTYVTEVAGH